MLLASPAATSLLEELHENSTDIHNAIKDLHTGNRMRQTLEESRWHINHANDEIMKAEVAKDSAKYDSAIGELDRTRV